MNIDMVLKEMILVKEQKSKRILHNVKKEKKEKKKEETFLEEEVVLIPKHMDIELMIVYVEIRMIWILLDKK